MYIFWQSVYPSKWEVDHILFDVRKTKKIYCLQFISQNLFIILPVSSSIQKSWKMRVCKLHNQIKVVWWFSGKFSRLENFREVSSSNEIGKSSQVFLVKRDCVQKPCRWVRPQPRIFLIRIETTSLSNILTGKKGLRNVHPYGHIFR